MKKTSILFATLLMTCSAAAMAQNNTSPTGGTVQGQGTGMTKTQANSTTLGNANAMGNGGSNSQTVGGARPYDDSVTTSTSNAYPASSPNATSPSTTYPSGSSSTGGISNSGPSTSPAHNQ